MDGPDLIARNAMRARTLPIKPTRAGDGLGQMSTLSGRCDGVCALAHPSRPVRPHLAVVDAPASSQTSIEHDRWWDLG
jgi:hypothetical protein